VGFHGAPEIISVGTPLDLTAAILTCNYHDYSLVSLARFPCIVPSTLKINKQNKLLEWYTPPLQLYSGVRNVSNFLILA
jgi:hypothetical protein